MLTERVTAALHAQPNSGPARVLRLPRRVAAGAGLLAAAAALFVVFQVGQISNPLRSPGGKAVSEVPANTVRYEFSFRASEAREVCLAGNFNHWKVCETPLMRVGEDLWKVSVELPKGRYEYMFVVDGQWVPDPSAIGSVQDGFGNLNSVVQL